MRENADVSFTVGSFYDEQTFTYTHVVADSATGACTVIDPVMGFDMSSGRTNTAAADVVAGYVGDRGLTVTWILETHAHADHLTAAPYLQSKLGGALGIGAGIRDVQRTFRKIYNLEPGFTPDGRQFDRLFEDGDRISVGNSEGRVIATPGHTSDSVTYVFGNAAFIGDTLFSPDYGSARCDFPGGDARQLFGSIQKLYGLSGVTEFYLCHDYPQDRNPQAMFTLADQKEHNVHLNGSTTLEQFAATRERRDAELGMPKLIIPAVQVNIRAGQFPPVEDNGCTYLKIPVNVLGRSDSD